MPKEILCLAGENARLRNGAIGKESKQTGEWLVAKPAPSI
jgi:hypothetical protein